MHSPGNLYDVVALFIELAGLNQQSGGQDSFSYTFFKDEVN